MTEQDYINAIPFLAGWEPKARAQFVEGVDRLQAIPLTGPIDSWVGVLLIDHTGKLDARVMPRADCLSLATGAEGMESQVREALEAVRGPGYFMIWIMTPWCEAVIGVPADRKHVSLPAPGSENN